MNVKRWFVCKFIIGMFWWYEKKCYLCIRFREATISQANVREMKQNRKRIKKEFFEKIYIRQK